MTFIDFVQYAFLPVIGFIFIIIKMIYDKQEQAEKDINEGVESKCAVVNARLSSISAELYSRVNNIESNVIPALKETVIRMETKISYLCEQNKEMIVNLKETINVLNSVQETLLELKMNFKYSKGNKND